MAGSRLRRRPQKRIGSLLIGVTAYARNVWRLAGGATVDPVEHGRDDMTGRMARTLAAAAALTAATGVAQSHDGASLRGDIGYTADTNFNIDWGDRRRR